MTASDELQAALMRNFPKLKPFGIPELQKDLEWVLQREIPKLARAKEDFVSLFDVSERFAEAHAAISAKEEVEVAVLKDAGKVTGAMLWKFLHDEAYEDRRAAEGASAIAAKLSTALLAAKLEARSDWIRRFAWLAGFLEGLAAALPKA